MENPNAPMAGQPMPQPIPGQPGQGQPAGEEGLPDLPPEQAKTIIAGLVQKLQMMADKYGIDLVSMIQGGGQGEAPMPPMPPGGPPEM